MLEHALGTSSSMMPIPGKRPLSIANPPSKVAAWARRPGILAIPEM
jgi:hypothetical protein